MLTHMSFVRVSSFAAETLLEESELSLQHVAAPIDAGRRRIAARRAPRRRRSRTAMDPAKFMAAEAAKAMLEAGPPSDDDDDDPASQPRPRPSPPLPPGSGATRVVALSRFLIKQQEDHRKAVKELQNGRKCSCWSWWIFPTPPWIVNGVRKGSATNWEYELKNDAAGTEVHTQPYAPRQLPRGPRRDEYVARERRHAEPLTEH